MAILPKKGLPQIKSGSGTQQTLAFCRFVNRRLSTLVAAAAKASRESRLNPIFVGAAKQQGNWLDSGRQAVRGVEQIIVNYATEKGLVDWEATARLAEKQLKTERDIDQVFDLLAILGDEGKRSAFLNELFKFHLRENI